MFQKPPQIIYSPLYTMFAEKSFFMKRAILFLLILVANSTFSQNTWEEINFPDSLSIRDINAEKEGILFVSAEGANNYYGFFRSYDNGTTWQTLDLGYPFNTSMTNAIKYSQDDILYLKNTHGFLKSYDNGDTFEIASETSTTSNELIISPDNDIYGIGWSLLLRSSDGCVTWDTLFQTDWGVEFTDIDFGLNGEIYFVCRDMLLSGEMGFYRSFDNGSSWEHIGITDQQLESIAVGTEGQIIVGGAGGVFTSSDLGASWTFVAEINADVMESYDGDKLIAGRGINNYSGCWFSEDWGSSWVSLVDSVFDSFVKKISISPSFTIYIQSDKIYKSINPIVKTESESFYSEIVLFPNPVNNRLFLFTPTKTGIERYVIYNQNGIAVQSGKLINNSIDVTKIKSGLYIAEFEFNNKVIRNKIIIE